MLPGFHTERSRRDIKHFYEWLGYQWGDHISEWMDLYTNRGDVQVHRVCILAPRGHSKSTTLRVKLAHSCLFSKWKGRPFTAWLFSASRDTASNRLEEIRADLRRHPDLRRMIDEKKGGKYNLRFTNGAWIKATGVSSAIRGEHPACIAMDDILTDLGDLSMENVTGWLNKVVTPMLDPGTSLYVVGTPMAKTDTYHTSMLNKDTWTTGVWSALPNWDEYRSDPEANPLQCLWPEQRPIDYLLEQRESMGDLAFAQELLCKVVDDDAQVYPRRYTRKNLDMDSSLLWGRELPGKYSIGFDPSHGLGQDYSVMVAIRQDEQGDLHFVNMWRRNDFPPAKQVDEIIRWNKMYHTPAFAAEEVGFQRLYESLLQQKGATVDYRPSKVSNKGLKQGLMNRLRVWFEQGKIHFPYNDDETRRAVNILLDELENHVWKGGDIVDVGQHNDVVMAFAHACDQFSAIGPSSSPLATSKTKDAPWSGKPNTNPRQFGGRFVRFGG